MSSLAQELNCTPQSRKVLAHLKKRGSITPMEALITYGITRLAARIHELRQAGFDIATQMKRDETKKPYATYLITRKK